MPAPVPVPVPDQEPAERACAAVPPPLSRDTAHRARSEPPRWLRALRAVAFLGLLLPAVARGADPGLPPVQPAPRIPPGAESAVLTALRAAGSGCPAGGLPANCEFDVRIVGGAVLELTTPAGRVAIGQGSPPQGDCPAAPPPLWVCPGGSAAADHAAAVVAAARLHDRPAAAAGLADLWQTAGPQAPGATPPLSRLLDGLLLLWLPLLATALVAALRRLGPQERWIALAVLLGGLVLRLAVPAGPANWYFAAAREGPFPGLYAGSYPVYFDSLYRAVAALPFADDAWFFAGHIALGALTPLLFFVGAAALLRGREPRGAVCYGVLLATAPFLVWLSRSDAHHVWPLALMAAAFLGFAHPSWRWGLPLALLSLVLGAGVRAETLPALFLSGLLVVAVGGFDRARERRTAGTTLVAAGVAAALYWAPVWTAVQAQQGSGTGRPVADVLASLGRVVTLRDPALPVVAWAAVVLPLGALGLVRLVRRRDWVRLPASVLGVLLAPAPLWLTGWSFDNVGHARYAALTWPFWLWLVAQGMVCAWEWLTAARLGRAAGAIRRRAAAAAVLLLPVGLFASAAPGLTGLAEWDAEYLFLRDNLGRLPADCTVTAVFSPESNAAGPGPAGELYDILLAHPHPLLTLRYRRLRWQIVPPGDPPPPPPPGCHAVLWGTACAAVAAGLDASWPAFANLDREAGRTCAALRATVSGPPLATGRYPLKEGRYPGGAFPDGVTELRLWRTR